VLRSCDGEQSLSVTGAPVQSPSIPGIPATANGWGTWQGSRATFCLNDALRRIRPLTTLPKAPGTRERGNSAKMRPNLAPMCPGRGDGGIVTQGRRRHCQGLHNKAFLPYLEPGIRAISRGVRSMARMGANGWALPKPRFETRSHRPAGRMNARTTDRASTRF
jgi:hypothetical protein